MNEYSLYKHEQYVKDHFIISNTEIIFLLGNLSDIKFVIQIFLEYDINILFHCAAYKHVSLLQKNLLTGIKNNLLSSFNIAKIASENNIEKCVLISSDKAVNPINIMGMTKKLSEKIFFYYSNKESKTKFTGVRFGNVFASSGSVIPLFINQIKNNREVNITHKDVSRYFMSTKEAAQLVILSSIMRGY